MAAAYPWTEQDGAWRRKLGSMESFYLAFASPEGAPVHWMIGCGVSIAYRGNDSVDIANSLRQAWKDTRRGFPNIAAVVDTNTREMVIGSDDSSAVEEWLQKSFQVHDAIGADELFSTFKSQFCITLHFLRDANELVIQAPHALSMGVVDDFLQPGYGDWELDHFWVSSTMLTGDFQMYLWTWRGRMVFSACYNDAFYGTSDVDAVLEKTRDEMLSGLGVV